MALQLQFNSQNFVENSSYDVLKCFEAFNGPLDSRDKLKLFRSIEQNDNMYLRKIKSTYVLNICHSIHSKISNLNKKSSSTLNLLKRTLKTIHTFEGMITWLDNLKNFQFTDQEDDHLNIMIDIVNNALDVPIIIDPIEHKRELDRAISEAQWENRKQFFISTMEFVKTNIRLQDVMDAVNSVYNVVQQHSIE